MTITINSPPELTAYFANPACQNSVYGVFDGSAIVGWHPDKTKAKKLFYELPRMNMCEKLDITLQLVKIHKDMKG